MKKIKLFAFLAFSSVLSISCSSDGDGGGVDQNEYFNYTTEGNDINITTWQAYRTEDAFEVLGQASDGTSMYFDFDVHGNLARASSTPADTSLDPWMSSYQNFPSHFFNFYIVGIDESSQMIKVNYSGKLYEDEYDINSAFSTVSGSFNVHYDVLTPNIADIHFTAKIGGQNWYSVTSTTSIYGWNDMHLQYTSGDAYMIDLNIDPENVAEGNFNFTTSSTVNRVILSKYNVSTDEYDEYASSGNLTITDIQDLGFGYKLLIGTFTINATSGSGSVQVTNGSFKTVFSN